MGTETDALDTQVSNVEGTSGDEFYLDNTGNLTIGGINGVTGISSANDTIVVRNAGSVDVIENVTADVDIEIFSLSRRCAADYSRPGCYGGGGE